MRLKVNKYQTFLVLGLILSTLVIGLQRMMLGNLAVEFDAFHDVTSIQGIGLGPLIWSDDFGAVNWSISGVSGGGASLKVAKSLNLTANFQAEQVPQAISVYRDVNLSLDQNPIAEIHVYVSSGVYYGVRFSGVTPDGDTFAAWRETSRLQHRPGISAFEDIKADLAAETYLANGQELIPGSRITRLWLYVEATPGTAGHFSLELGSLKAYALERVFSTSSEIRGVFSGVIVALMFPALNQTLFQAYASYDISGSSGLTYTPLLVRDAAVIAGGFTYSQTPSSHQVAVLLPERASGFPSILPDQNATDVILEADEGSITFFRLDDVTLRYTATPDLAGSGETVQPATAEWFILYYLLFLLITPVVATVLLLRAFESER